MSRAGGAGLLGVELEEAGVPGANLADVHLVEPGVGVGADPLEVILGRRAARSGDHVLRHQFRQLREVPRQRQQLGRFAGNGLVRPEPVHGLAGPPGVGIPAHLEAALHRPVAAAGVAVEPDEVRVRLDADIAVRQPGRQLDGLLAEAGHEDRRRRVGDRVQPGRVDPVMRAVMGDEPPLNSSLITSTASSSMSSRSSADGQAVPRMCSFSASPLPTPSVNRPPVSSEDVAAAWAMIGGMGAQQRAGHRGGDRKRGTRGDGADHRPDEAALALLVQPGVVMVGDPQGVESGLLGHPGLPDELGRAGFLGGKEISVTCHIQACS